MCATSADTTLAFGVNEAYTLSVPATGAAATINAPTVWGALYGLETFAQLVELQSLTAFVDLGTLTSPSATTFATESILSHVRSRESLDASRADDPSNAVYVIHGTPISISDSPRFPWRGIMIDTARHFLPLPAVLHVVDAAAQNKLNVLHWSVCLLCCIDDRHSQAPDGRRVVSFRYS